MPLPTSSSDIQIQVPCIICNGNATFGSSNGRTASPCENCRSSGWQTADINKLTPKQLDKLRALLPALPFDPAAPLGGGGTMTQISKLLTRRWIETITFPHEDATAIDLIDKRGGVLRLTTRQSDGKTNITATPLPPET